MPIAWPPVLVPTEISFSPVLQSKSGGVSVTGHEQVIVSNAGRWQCDMTIGAVTEERVLALRSLVAQAHGRAGIISIPAFDAYLPMGASGRLNGQLAARLNGEYMFNHSGFAPMNVDAARLAAHANRGVTQITVDILDGDGPRPGHYFGIGERLYIVEHVWREAVDGPAIVRFWPTLRADAPMGEPVILDRPKCLMRLASDDVGRASLTLGRWAQSVGLSFVEAF